MHSVWIPAYAGMTCVGWRGVFKIIAAHRIAGMVRSYTKNKVVFDLKDDIYN